MIIRDGTTKGVANSLVTLVERCMAYVPNVNVSVSKSELAYAKQKSFLGKHVIYSRARIDLRI